MEIPHLFVYNKSMENFLNIGIIIKTRGLKGVVKVKSTTYFANLRYKKGNKLYLVNEQTNEIKEVTVNYYTHEGEFDFVGFKEITSIDEAEKLKGWYIQVNKDEIPSLPKNTYYFSDLVGLTTYDETDNAFGEVIKVEDFTSQISLRIKLLNSTKTVLIPFVKFYIKKVDLENKKIIIHLIEGMLP